MLLEAGIDGYKTDDDATAIGRYLTAVGDRKRAVSADIADWIITRIHDFSGEATPQLLSGYMHFLRADVKAAPFSVGPTGSPRRRLLLAIEQDLVAYDTPLTDFALLFFLESDDAELVQVAQSTGFRNLKRFPWQIGGDEWTNWATIGLNPDVANSNISVQDPEFPVVTAAAKAGLLTHVRGVLAPLDLRPPLARSAMFTRFMHSTVRDAQNFAHIQDGSYAVVTLDVAARFAQLMAFGKIVSERYATTLGVPKKNDAEIQQNVDIDLDSYEGIGREIANLYVRTVSPPRSDMRRGTSGPGPTLLAEALTAQQARLAALAAYGLVVDQQRHGGTGEDLPVEQVFVRLGAIRLPENEKKTRLVPSFSQEELAQATGVDLAKLAQCAPSSFKLMDRRISVRSRLYVEQLLMECADGSQSKLLLKGSLSTDFARLLEINENYLDIIGKSLVALSVAAFRADPGIAPPDDVTLIQNDPWSAIAESLATYAHPNTPWKFSRAVLRQHYPRSVQWFMPGWRPLSVVDEQELQTKDPVLTSSQEFPTVMQALTRELPAVLQAEAKRRFVAKVRPIVEAMDDARWVCYSAPGYGMTCSSHPTAKAGLLNSLNSIAAEAARVRTSLLSDRACATDPIPVDNPAIVLNDKVQTAVDPDGQYVVRYQSGDCIGSASGMLPPPVASILLPALEQDPRLLNRYQLNLLQETGDQTQRLMSVLANAAFEVEQGSQLLARLRASDLIWYLPSIPAPLSAAEDHSNFAQVVIPLLALVGGRTTPDWPVYPFDSPVNVAIGALLRDPSGLDLASDITALQDLQRALPQRGAPGQFVLTTEFLTKLRAAEQDAFTKVDAEADRQAAPVIAAINAQQNSSSWSFGVFVGVGANVIPGFAINYNGVQLGVAINAPMIQISGGILGITVPIAGLPVFGTNSPSPGLAPQLPIPLADPQETGGSRSPASATEGPVLGPPGGDPNTVVVELPGVQWPSLLAQTNIIGRQWLEQQILIATPVLSEAELAAIRRGLEADVFPVDLARLIAEKVIQVASQQRIPGDPTAAGPAVEAACRLETWTSCALEVRRVLEGRNDAATAVAVATEWGKSFDKAYNRLRQKGQLERATPEAERIQEVLIDAFSPVEIAKDHAREELVKRYFPQLAPAVKWAYSPMATVLKALFDSQEVGTELDELLTTDDAIQEATLEALKPELKMDWQEKFDEMILMAQPRLRAP